MNLTEKQELVKQWNETFKEADSIVLANYSGLKANEMNVLRGDCREAGVEFHIAKNTLIKRALEGTPFEFLSEHFRGTVAIAIGTEDQIAPAKVLVKTAKDFKTFEVLAGALDGQGLDVQGVESLSKLPGRDELRGQFLGLLNAVPGGFVRLLNAVPGGMVNVLDARKRQLEEQAA